MKKSTALSLILFVFLSYPLFTVFAQDNTVIKTEGEKVFEENCKACHSLDKVKIGPALKGISKKMPLTTFKKFLRFPKSLDLENAAFYKSNANYNRPYMHASMTSLSSPGLTDNEIEALLRFIEKIPEPSKPIVAEQPKIQTSVLDSNGILDIQLGKSFESIKHLLLKDPVERHYWVVQREYYKQQKWESESDTIIKDAYIVKPTEKKYYTLWNIPVKSIEVRFNEKRKVISIMIMMEKSSENNGNLSMYIEKQFGYSRCANAVEDFNSFHCSVGNEEAEEPLFRYYTSDGFGETSINDYLYIRYCRSLTGEMVDCY